MPISLGLLVTNKKFRRLNDVKMFDAFEKYGIEYYRIDTSLPLEQQKPVDAILHKLIDQLNITGEENEAIVRWMEKTQKEHPDLLFLDSMTNLYNFLRRTYSYEVAEESIRAIHAESVLSVPAYFFLPKGKDLREAMKENHMELPVLVKPQWTTGDASSHAIDILLTESSIPSHYDIDMVVQSYKDHNGIIYKSYAIADTCFTELRYSLPNTKECHDSIGKYTIDRLKKCPTSFSANTSEPTKNNEIIHGKEATTEILTETLIQKFLLKIEEVLGMDLIGVDFIIDSEDVTKVYCIDINLFPSYTGFDNVSEVMAKWILRKCSM